MPDAVAEARREWTLADFTSAPLVAPRLSGEDAATVIKELSQALQHDGRVPDFLLFYQAALNREFLVNTGTESGLAVPHARLAGVKELCFAFGRSDQPMAWGTRPGRMIRLVFLLAVPATDTTQYLRLISSLGRLAGERQYAEPLYTARDSQEILEVLQQVRVTG